MPFDQTHDIDRIDLPRAELAMNQLAENDPREHELRLTDDLAEGLPDVLAELGRQLQDDSARLADCYPARSGDRALVAAVPSRTSEAAESRWIGRRLAAWNVAAAVVVLAGLTVIANNWRPGTNSSSWTNRDPATSSHLPLPAAPGFSAASVAEPETVPPTLVQPTFISTESVRQLSGEKIEILADSPGRQIADI